MVLKEQLYLFLLLMIWMSCASCSEDFLTTTVDIDVPEYEKKIVINTSIEAGKTYAPVYIGENYGILDYRGFDAFVSGGLFEVTNLTTNETISSIEDLSGGFNNYIEVNSSFFKGGDEYMFRAEFSGYPVSETILTCPNHIPIRDLVYTVEGGVDSDGEESSSIEFMINDPADKDNFYGVKVRILDLNQGSEYTVDLFSPIIGGIDYGYRLLFDDTSFNGDMKRIELRIPRMEIEQDELILVEWQSISKSTFLYEKSLKAYLDSEDNPFLTAVKVRSNVNNGYGVISLNNTAEYPVR